MNGTTLETETAAQLAALVHLLSDGCGLYDLLLYRRQFDERMAPLLTEAASATDVKTGVTP